MAINPRNMGSKALARIIGDTQLLEADGNKKAFSFLNALETIVEEAKERKEVLAPEALEEEEIFSVRMRMRAREYENLHNALRRIRSGQQHSLNQHHQEALNNAARLIELMVQSEEQMAGWAKQDVQRPDMAYDQSAQEWRRLLEAQLDQSVAEGKLSEQEAKQRRIKALESQKRMRDRGENASEFYERRHVARVLRATILPLFTALNEALDRERGRQGPAAGL